MGGAFGGKETQAAQWAAIAALGARITGRPCKIRLDRDDDMMPDRQAARFPRRLRGRLRRATARIRALETVMASRCGYSADLSGAINDRAMFHADNAYYLPAATITTKRMKTNTVSNTAFRGFGGPQGMMVVERAIDEIAWALGLDPLDVRKRNLYREGRDVTPYGMVVEDNILPALIDRCEIASDYRRRRAPDRRSSTPQSAILEARHRADAGEVRHLVHHHASQSGRRAGARLSGRLDPSEPRRHRDGAGALHQGRAGGGRGIRRRRRAREDHRDHHRQGAEHVGDRGVVRLRHQRHGGEERRRRDQGAADRVRGRELRRRRRTRSSSATTACSSATSRCRSPNWSSRPISRASRCRRPASTRRRRSTGTPRPGRAGRSSISPMARRAPRCWSTSRPAR